MDICFLLHTCRKYIRIRFRVPGDGGAEILQIRGINVLTAKLIDTSLRRDCMRSSRDYDGSVKRLKSRARSRSTCTLKEEGVRAAYIIEYISRRYYLGAY